MKKKLLILSMALVLSCSFGCAPSMPFNPNQTATQRPALPADPNQAVLGLYQQKSLNKALDALLSEKEKCNASEPEVKFIEKKLDCRTAERFWIEKCGGGDNYQGYNNSSFTLEM